MQIEFLVEEESAESALQILIPKIAGEDVSFAIRVFQGKHDLMNKLPMRLRAYRNYVFDDFRIVVLVDRDNHDCKELKEELEEAARGAGFITRSAAEGSDFQILNRIAIEEMEAWFFGDAEAIAAAYPKVSRNIGDKAKYRIPDSITGGTWESLERALQRAGYYKGGMPKIEVARKVAEHMLPERNRSKSFQVFRDALSEMAGQN